MLFPKLEARRSRVYTSYFATFEKSILASEYLQKAFSTNLHLWISDGFT